MLVGYGPSDAPPSRRRNRRAHRDRGPAEPAHGGSRPLAAPPVRFMARQNGVDLADVTGHGQGGIITREDLAAHLAGAASVVRSSPSAPGRESRAPVRGVQKHMAEAMVRSIATAPQACVFLTIDVTPTVQLVERLRQNRHFEGLHVTVLAVVTRAMVLALRDHPGAQLVVGRRHFRSGHEALRQPGGGRGGPAGPCRALHQGRAGHGVARVDRSLGRPDGPRPHGRVRTPADLSGGTITVTNVGVFGVDAGVPILNPGEAAILAVGTVHRRPWEFGDEVALRDVVVLSLAFDHRLVDGRTASLFLGAVGEILADPTNLIALG